MSEKIISFKIAAMLASNFANVFIKANNQIASTNKNLVDYQKQFSNVLKYQQKGMMTTESLNNIYEKFNLQFVKMPELQNKLARYSQAALTSWGNFSVSKDILSLAYNLSSYAMKFESAMADVRKVVDFDTPKQFKEMGKDILDLSTRIPMAAEGLAQIVAAGGQSGIARGDLIKFAEAAAKMGVAFDVTAEQAGEMMAKWRTAFKMNQDDVVKLADKINYLGNTTAASAPLISDVVTRIGPLGAVGGVASGEIAALGASLVGSGINSEIAATGIKNMILALAAGEAATKKQSEAYAELGLNAIDMASAMQKDSRSAILSVLDALNKVSGERRAGILTSLFGKESIGAITPLLTNLDSLKKNFEAVGNASQYTGSMEAEFSARSQTTANSIQLMENRIAKAKIQMSAGFLPIITKGSELLGSMATWVGNLTEKYPGLTSAIAGGTLALFGFCTVVSAATFAINAYKTTMAALEIAQTKWAILSKLSAAAQWLFNASLYGCPIIAIGAAMVAVGYIIYKNWDEIAALGARMWDGVKQGWQSFYDLISPGIEWIMGKWNALSKLLDKPIFGKISVPNTSVAVESNASGGIYSQGAFLTTFAETSGESAIPHTPTARNIGLLAKTNEIMGSPLGGNSINATFAPVINVSGGDSSQISSMLDDKMQEFKRMLQDLQRQERRLSYG